MLDICLKCHIQIKPQFSWNTKVSFSHNTVGTFLANFYSLIELKQFRVSFDQIYSQIAKNTLFKLKNCQYLKA